MPAGIQKNVRLPQQAAEALRALKYDLDASDGEAVALALESKAVERLRYHAAILRRNALDLVPDGDAARSRAAAAALLAALNWAGKRYRIEEGRLMANDGGAWHPGTVAYGHDAQRIVTRAEERARELPAAEVTPAVLLLACCEDPRADRFSGLGVDAATLSAHLRRSLEARAAAPAPRRVRFTEAAKSAVMEGAVGLAALEGLGSVEVEHVLVAALQSEDSDVTGARQALGIDADRARGLLLAGGATAAEASKRSS